jgi:hypothetical protein
VASIQARSRKKAHTIIREMMWDIYGSVMLLLFLALPVTVTHSLMVRLAPNWWRKRYVTTRLFLPSTLVTLALWALSEALSWSTPRPYSHGDTFAVVGQTAFFLSLLTAILGIVALVRWFVGIGTDDKA